MHREHRGVSFPDDPYAPYGPDAFRLALHRMVLHGLASCKVGAFHHVGRSTPCAGRRLSGEHEPASPRSVQTA